MLEFEIKGYADTQLTPVIYIIQAVWCIIVLFPLAFVIRCWIRFEWIRHIRTGFTLYLSGIDCASRLIFLAYYILRLYTIYHDGIWMVETDDGSQMVVSTLPNCHGRDPNWTIPGCRFFENTISRRHCLTFSLFLYWASTWPVTAVLLLQINALVASVAPATYSRISNVRVCGSVMLAGLCMDIAMGIVAYKELSDTYVYDGEPEIMDACKFEYFSRLSINGSWYILALLLAIGVVALTQLGVSCINRRRRKNFVNPVANSPVHGWTRMTKNEQRLTTAILVCSIASFILFIIHFIVYLVEGNSVLREVLSITISVFSFFGPVEMMWFNIDLRKAVFILLLGEEHDRKYPPPEEPVDVAEGPKDLKSDDS